MPGQAIQNRNDSARKGLSAVVRNGQQDTTDPATLCIYEGRYRRFLTPELLGYRIPSRGGM